MTRFAGPPESKKRASHAPAVVVSLAQGLIMGLAAGTTTAVMRGGRISATQIAVDAFGTAIGNALGSSIAAQSMSGGSGQTAYQDGDIGRSELRWNSAPPPSFPDLTALGSADGFKGYVPPSVDRSQDVLLAAGDGFTMGRGPVSVGQSGRTVYISDQGQPSIDAMLSKAQADLQRLRDEALTAELNRNSVIRETVTPIFEPITVEVPPVVSAVVGGVGDVLTGGIAGLADMTVAPIADVAQAGLKALHGSVTGDYQPMTPMSSYADSVVNGGAGVWEGIKATGVNVFNVSPLGMVYHAGTGGYGLTTAAMNGDVRAATREGLGLGLNFAGAAAVRPLGSSPPAPVGPSSRIGELQAKWGGLSAAERRALLESKSEATWSDWLAKRDAEAKAANPNAHFSEKHGPGTTLLDQEIRATTKKAPDGSTDPAFRDSTRFLSARDMGRAMQRADSLFQLNGGVNKPYIFEMEGLIGEGYTKAPNSNWMFTTNVNAVYRNGQPYTMFPLLRPLP